MAQPQKSKKKAAADAPGPKEAKASPKAPKDAKPPKATKPAKAAKAPKPGSGPAPKPPRPELAAGEQVGVDALVDRRGQAGETEQQARDGQLMTTAQGQVMSSDMNSLKAGERGPVLLEDFALREKTFHFDHERIPERVVHARGYGAHGVFEATEDISELTRAAVFTKGERTEAFVRFSTVAGEKGSMDLARDVRGFAVKLYTREGNWDLVGNNIPVFFIQDAIKFPDLIHSVKPAPDRAFPQAQSAHDEFWDFISLMPEAIHMTLWQMSDRAIPRSFRFMEGFGVHTFRFVNAAGEQSFVKFHWKPVAGLQSVVWNEAVKINGADPDFHRRDLYDAITTARSTEELPAWELGIQVMDEAFAESFEFDLFDPTKLVPEEQVPVRVVGRLTLDRVVDNDFAETEQVAFCTQNIVPGIDFTPDPLLQGRNFSYLDTQLSRLGSTNFTKLPVNAPRCPVMNFQRDGHMQTDIPRGRVNYEPNSFTDEARGPRPSQEEGFTSFPTPMEGMGTRYRSETFADHYSQARQFFVSQTPVEQDHIVKAYVFELGKCEIPAIRLRVLSHLVNVDAGLATKVAEGLGMELPEPATAAIAPRTDLPPSDALSILKRGPQSFMGRKLGILVTNGADAALVAALEQAIVEAHATSELIAPKIGPVTLSDGSTKTPDHFLDGAPSVIFDAVALVLPKEGAKELAGRSTAKDFVSDAFAHHKFVGHTAGAAALLEAAGVVPDEGFIALSPKKAGAFLQTLGALRFWDRPVQP